MSMLWVVIFVALAGSQLGHGLPLRSTPESYPHDAYGPWWVGVYAVPVAALVAVAAALLGCTWCYRHKDSKTHTGADNQLFTSSATQLHDVRRSNPPDSGFSESANNNITEDNNNGPISLREMQNIANNNAAAYIVSENEERNRASRESMVEFEPLPGIRVVDPLERCADWFGGEDFQRSRLQYLREFARGWFGRVVEGEIETNGTTNNVAVKILNQNANLEDKARFLEEARVYRDITHENILGFVGKCLQEDPWILIFELCPMDLRTYLLDNRPKMAILNDAGVPLRLMCDVTTALAYLHARGICGVIGPLNADRVSVRGAGPGESPRALLGSYVGHTHNEVRAPETRRQPAIHTAASEVWSLGIVVWEVSAWGCVPTAAPPPPPDLPCPYRGHLYQVMQLCWNANPEERPSAAQVLALLSHLHATHTRPGPPDLAADFEDRWQILKPNSIPKLDEHVAIVHAPSTSTASHFTGSDDYDRLTQDTLSVNLDMAVSRSSSIMSEKDPLSVQIKSESLTNLHGSLDDVRNIYLTHNETPLLECHQGNMSFEERDHDRSDSSVDPWLKDIIAGSQDDVSYYKDVSDVIKNLDNILNSEKTSSSESSHQASPSRDNLSLDCKKDYPIQSSMVKSPGINNFKNFLELSLDLPRDEPCDEDDVDRETIGTLSHSFERHGDTISQNTLENLTPDTPVKDLDFISEDEGQSVLKEAVVTNEAENAAYEIQEDELPKENNVVCKDNVPKLKDLCACVPSLSDKEQLVIEDCETPCDILTDTVEAAEEVNTKSVDNTSQNIFEDSINVEEVESPETELNGVLDNAENKDQSSANVELSKSVSDNVPANIESETERQDAESVKDIAEQVLPTNIAESRNVDAIACDEFILNEIKISSNLVESKPLNDVANLSPDVIKDNAVDLSENVANEIVEEVKCKTVVESQTEVLPLEPDSVQNVEHTVAPVEISDVTLVLETTHEATLAPILPTEEVQKAVNDSEIETGKTVSTEGTFRSEMTERETNDSTVYMDLINDTNSDVRRHSIDNNVKEVYKDCFEKTGFDSPCEAVKDDSTVYLDLPSMLKETGDFLDSERMISGQVAEIKNEITASTPKGSVGSVDTTLDNSIKEADLSETQLYELEARGGTKLEFKTDNPSPLDSPSKSHHTDTYDENSSVVLGPFENSSLELFKGLIDMPKEELLAFSSNFSEMNLETPSPLRDGNFLNEVPDIVNDDLLEDVTTSEVKMEVLEPSTENTDETDESGTAKHISPSTPPNSPGIFLASTSQQKYIVDIDLDMPNEGMSSYPPIESDSGLSSLQKEIDLNQIELQITSKLAMAENENNMNIEYSGPLTVEGIVSEEGDMLRESEAIPEAILAGNGGSVEDLRESFALDEACVRALRNELELKLPLAQVASIEPPYEEPSEPDEACQVDEAEGDSWSSLPPPPELVLSYGMAPPSALSPIAEETCHQLSAYENDAYHASARTDSSSSYLEPCNLSTDEVTDLPTATARGTGSTYTVTEQKNRTYTVKKDGGSSKEVTMSADSLNGSPCKKPTVIDDRTYNKDDGDDEKISHLEHLSQVSPCVLSPTTDTSAPGSDNATGVSTLSKTTVPTDAKLSKPSECLSKPTSIDSWCSNDTLYNVEENFDDLVIDTDIPLEFEKSASTETLTHAGENEKELSHCSTYIVHDSKSDESFSPDSITAIDNHTYTIAKSDIEQIPSDIIQPVVAAFVAIPTYTHCNTEVMSAIDDPWKLQQPELIRRSPVSSDISFVTPKAPEVKSELIDSPQTNEPCVKKMDSVDLSCLQDETIDSIKATPPSQVLLDTDSPKDNFNRDMAPSVTSTPLLQLPVDNEAEIESKSTSPASVQNFQMFMQSAEIRPQDISPNLSSEPPSLAQDTGFVSKNSHSQREADCTPSYIDFENSVVTRPQELSSRDRSALSIESGMSSGEYRNFEISVVNRPQDLSSVIDASSIFLHSERLSSHLHMNSNCGELSATNEPSHETPLDTPQNIDKDESHSVAENTEVLIVPVIEEETEQPHSIIITDITNISNKSEEVAVNIKEDNTCNGVANDSPNRTYDSHELNVNKTFDSHINGSPNDESHYNDNAKVENTVNGIDNTDVEEGVKENQNVSKSRETDEVKGNNIPNGSKTENDSPNVVCNGDSENYATVNFINESFEELPASVRESQSSKVDHRINETTDAKSVESLPKENIPVLKLNGVTDEPRVLAVTEDFLRNEKIFSEVDAYLPMLNDIRFTGPATEIMSTSFTEESPTEPEAPELDQDNPRDAVADIVKEWDSDSDSESTNSSSGEFIWKGGDGHETPVVPTTHFDHQQQPSHASHPPPTDANSEHGSCSGDGDSASGSEGDEVEFVPSSWDCLAAPAKSSLRSLEQTQPDNKKRVVFKRQKYHCVYEYPREAAPDVSPAAYLPDFSTYCEWDTRSAEEAALGYGRLYAPMHLYSLPTNNAHAPDFDEDFFISSSARPFESLGIMSTTSQFFPGMHVKPGLLDRDDEDEYQLPSAPSHTTLRTPSLDFTTPDSGVEDITPGSTEEELKKDVGSCWRPADSTSSIESVSPSSPASETLGGLRHTRDKLKLDLPPSPHLPSPRHYRVFNFVLDKPKRRVDENPTTPTPLVMTDETPVVTTTLPLQKDAEPTQPEPTFSTFGKCTQKNGDSEQKMILTDEAEQSEVKTESPKVETKEGTTVDSGDEDSGIESSSKATLERKTPNVS